MRRRDSAACFVEVLVDESNRDRTLSDRRRDAFGGAGSHISGCEHAGQASLEEERGPGERPRARGFGVGRQVALLRVRFHSYL